MIDIISIEDFDIRPLMINDSNQDELILFDGLLAEIQPVFFENILGSLEYNRMLSDYDDNTKTFTDPFYTAFIFDGADYVNDDVTIKYKGVKQALKYWFYINWLGRNPLQTGRAGLGMSTSENEEMANPIGVQAALNSQLIRLVGTDWNKVNQSICSYNILGNSNRYQSTSTQTANLKYENSIFNFLNSATNTPFTDWLFTGFESKNSFGI